MASDINTVTLVGRLTRDPEARQTPTGLNLCEASVAVNSAQKKGDAWEEVVSFFNVTCFGKTAEALCKYGKKGHRVGINGKLLQRRWEAQDGTKRERVQVTANNVQFLSDKTKEPEAQGPPVVDDGVPF
jgi:single-strand DNA-binding protein